jgi:DNA polymerase-4
LGSDLQKPDATTIISRENFQKIVHPLPVSDLLFVGRATKEKLHRHGIFTIGHLAQAGPDFLQSLLGKIGFSLYQYAIGSKHIGNILSEIPPVKSVSNSVTSAEDLLTLEDIWIQLLMLGEHVASRMRLKNMSGTLITLFVRNTHFKSITRQRPLPLATNNAMKIAQTAFDLFKDSYDLSTPVRCIGLGVSKLQTDTGDLQLTLCDLDGHQIKEHNLDETVDHLRDRYGFNCVVRAGCLHQQLKNYTLSADPGAPSSLCTLPGCHL